MALSDGVLGISAVGFDHELCRLWRSRRGALSLALRYSGFPPRAAVHPDGVAPELGGAIDPAFVLVDGSVALGLVFASS